ncbi:polyhydroxyalkanoate synthesis regulator phasin [Streptomyces sp. PvR006]|uniref:hypothetical protein n=1 Tax=Streptomyces sp. PvR006 TaxID=2817860 RepID=UPI001AE18E95|nr:hypothetical protein [Streptomyces sp. PvR006]MBP2583401.1 polyhydroxyalkanoate synthesis regulator phasin [Streptomyces sp. PvR006]
MAERLTFVLEGRDDLSRVLGHAGESAERLRRQMEDAADGSGRAMLTLTQDADGRLRDLEGRFISTADAAALMATRTGDLARPTTTWAQAADDGAKAGEALKKALVTLAPAAIPAVAALAPIAPAVLAGAAAAGVYGIAVGAQISAMTEAAESEKKYTDAVAESGARSEAAVKAQVAHAKAMAKLPPETRAAAAALSVFKDEYADWSDSLAGDTMAPVTHGLAVMQGILPKLSPMVRGFSGELDRTVTIAAGGVSSPGFDAFADRMGTFSTGVMDGVNDSLVTFLRKLDTDEVGTGVAEFLAWCREQGPEVRAILGDVGETVVNVLDASADMGVGMLQVVAILAKLASAVPPETIALLLQLAVAIRVVNLAAAGTVAARTAMAAMGTQIVAMRTAASGAPGPLAAAGAAISGLSRTAKLALAGTGLGLLVIALAELSAGAKNAPPDVDKLTGSLKQLGATGQVTGEAAKAFGSDLDGLYDKVRSLTDPSTADNIQQWIVTLGGLGTWDSTPVKAAKENVDAIDKALASLVSSGNSDLAAAAAKRLADEYAQSGRSTDQFTGQLDDYQTAVANARFEAELAADAQGLFGRQALETRTKLDAQKASADGLRQSLQLLNDVNRAGLGAQVAFEAALDATTEAARKNAGAWGVGASTYDLTTEKGRTAATALTDLAAKTDAATAAARESGASWSTVNGIYDRGRSALVASAQQMGLSEAAAKRLADQILRTPDKTARVRGNLEDLQAKLADAKKRLAAVPDSKRAAIRAEISQLEAQVARAKGAIASVQGKTVSVMIDYRTRNSGASNFAKSIGGYAGGGTPRAGEWAWVGEEGPELMHFGRDARVYDHRTSMTMAGRAGPGRDVGAGLVAGMLGSRSDVERAARVMAAGVEDGIRAELEIASPSRKTKRLMGHAGDGAAEGLAKARAKLKAQMKPLMDDVRNGILRGLTGSKAQIQATAADLNKDIWAAWAGQKTNKDSNLVKLINREHDKLQKLASRRDTLASKVKGAQDLLRARIEEQANYRSSVRSTAQSASSLSSLGLDPAQVTTGAIRGGLQQKLERLRQFNRYVTALTKRGLNKNLLRQVLAMGPEDGFAYAAALAGMTNADFKSTNSIQAAIDRESDSLGRTGAKTLYDAGVNSAKGLVSGLQSQQRAIEQQMVKIAKGMERAIKQALGIKSPSRVAWAITTNFMRSLGGGALAEIPYLDRVMGQVSGRMAGIRPEPGRPTAGQGVGAAAGGSAPVYITVQGAIDPVSTAKQLQKVLITLKRTNGGGGLSLE